MKKRYLIGKRCFVLSLLMIIPSVILAYYEKKMASDFIFMIILALFTSGSWICTYKNNIVSQNTARQMAVCSLLSFLFWSLNFFYRYLHIDNELSFCGILGWIMLFFNMYLWLDYCLTNIKMKNFSWNFVKKWLIKNADWLSVASIFILLNMDIYNLWIKSDGYIYYKGLLSNIGQWDFSLSSMDKFQMAGHLTAGYSILGTIGTIILGKNGFRVTNMVMAVITIYCFKKILLFFTPGLNKICAFIIQIIFAFAPLFFGISYEISADYPIFAFFVWFICCCYYNKRILALFIAFLFCFTKECSPVFLLGFLIGEFIYYATNIWKNKKQGILKQLKYYLINSYVYTAYAGIVYSIVFLCSNTSWIRLGKNSLTGQTINTVPEMSAQHMPGGRATGFGLDYDYIVTKLNELFFMNFNWVIFLFLFIACIILICQKKKLKLTTHNNEEQNISLLPIWTAWISFLLFNLLFITYVNYRYIQLHWFFYVFLLSILVNKVQYILKKVYAGLAMIAVLLLTECYITVDPVTYLTFDKINVGNIQVVTTKKYIAYDNILYTKEERDDVRGEMLFDSLTYNRQCIALEKLTEKAFASIDYNSDMKVILPPILNGKTAYTYRGYLGRPEFDTYFWNDKTHNITDNTSDIKINFEDYYSFIDNAKTGETVYYLQYPYVVGFDEKTALESQFETKNVIPFEFNGWTMNILKLCKK